MALQSPPPTVCIGRVEKKLFHFVEISGLPVFWLNRAIK